MKKAASSSAEPMPTVGEGLIEAFTELAAHLRGEAEVESYEFVPPEDLSPARIRAIRESVGSRKVFEKMTGIPAGTIDGYERGRRRPDAATQALFRIIEREPEAVRRALVAEGRAA
ncbi:transcriptional regulator [Xanthobacter sp. V4C-4]|uniref:helix-turn-helix domain-containing protein n=1 Tax=Xanthobacter cornucopiae TaxID=3119924 RepID=UPI00372914F8